jgi:hypothetical protein
LSFYACHFANNKKECAASCPQNAENLKESEHTKDFFGRLISSYSKHPDRLKLKVHIKDNELLHLISKVLGREVLLKGKAQYG